MATKGGSATETRIWSSSGPAIRPQTKSKVADKWYSGYILERGTPGFTTEVIKNKLALRPIQNCNLYFKDAFVPEENRLSKAKDFASGTNVVLKHSRVFICWQAMGIAIGAYDNAVKYATSRQQFGQPIAGKHSSDNRLPANSGKACEDDVSHPGRSSVGVPHKQDGRRRQGNYWADFPRQGLSH